MAWVRFRKKDMPGGLWGKCPRCSEMVYTKDLQANLNVCPKCQHHLPCDVDDRIRFTLDEGSFIEVFEDLMGTDRLNFKDKTTYAEKLEDTARKVKRSEGMVIGLGRIQGREVESVVPYSIELVEVKRDDCCLPPPQPGPAPPK